MVTKMNNHGKGNRKRQRKRRNARKKNLPPKQEKKVLVIDGNLSYYPVAYCYYHDAYVTQGQLDTHRCKQRHCKRLEMIVPVAKGGDAL